MTDEACSRRDAPAGRPLSRRDFARTLAAGGLALTAGCIDQRRTQPVARRPNLVLMIADNLGLEALGAYGGTLFSTPRLDALAREGATFDGCYIGSPLCCPARISLMTGRYPHALGMNHQPKPEDPEDGLPLDELTLADTLKAAGYRTALFGKWNLGYGDKYLPTFRGFDTYYGINAGHADYYTHVYDADGKKHFYRDTERIDPEGYVDNLCVDEALAYLDAQRGAGEPFFLDMAFFAPHGPYQSPPGYPEGKDADERYRYMIENLDANVGRLLDKLDETGAAANTLVVFISDQGSARPNPFKRDLTEGGLRVACLARWPGRTVPGLRIPTPVTSYDWFTTFTEAGGGSVPRDRCIVGRNLARVLEGDPSPVHEAMFWTFGNEDAVRVGDWKLHLKDGAAAGLYDLSQDPQAQRDRSAEFPQRVAALRERLLAWKADPLPRPKA